MIIKILTDGKALIDKVVESSTDIKVDEFLVWHATHIPHKQNPTVINSFKFRSNLNFGQK